jgi:hypothetical protein
MSIEDEDIRVWSASKTDASKAVSELVKDRVIAVRKDATTVEIDVPTKKAELLNWLNKYAR